MNKLSVIIPSYRNPGYLRLALSSLLSGRETEGSEILVVIDGFREMYEELMKEFSGIVRFVVLTHNSGMMNAINVGVSRATSEFVLITNEDIVAPAGWDRIIEPDLATNRLLGVDCIEPHEGSLFGFPAFNAGETLKEFNLHGFLSQEAKTREEKLSTKSYIMPFAIHRADYMRIGGFDASNFSGPYLVDDDFFLRCQLAGIQGVRTLKVRFYHFSGKSTKHRDDRTVDTNFFEVEKKNVAEFYRKWGFTPGRLRETNEVIVVGGETPKYLEGRIRSV